MVKKKLISPDETGKLLVGINKMADAVKSTLGPKGKNVLIQDEFGNVRSTKDGVTVARSLYLEDPVEDLAARVLREVASKTNDVVGDGTTTATVLAQKIINYGFNLIDKGSDSNILKKEIDDAVEIVCKRIDSMRIPISFEDKELLERVAVISANNDEKLGKLLSEAFVKVGKKGIVTVQEGKRTEDYFEHAEGLRFSRGYLSSSFINNMKNKSCEYENPAIIIVGEKITAVDPLFDFLQKVQQSNPLKKPILLICEDIDEKILSLLVLNKMRGQIDICVIKSPGINLERSDLLVDIAVITGGKIISSELANSFETADIRSVGLAESVKVTDNSTTILGGNKNEKVFKEHIENLSGQVEAVEEEYFKKKLEERIAKLLGGIGIIYAGGISEIEVKEKMDRIDDALHALQAALEGGILPGGGTVFLKCIDVLPDSGKGYEIIRKVLAAPLHQMLVNSGITASIDADRILQEVKTRGDMFGYNVLLGRYEDNMLSAGIIDATKVLKSTLRSAASVAGLFLTTSYVIANTESRNEDF